MNRTLSVIFMTIWLDAVGIGLIFPVLPQLLKSVMQTADIAPYIGILAALYALMQFIFAPLLGALSDNFGRRPVLLVSLAGAVVNYLMMAFSSHLGLLLIGRAVAGLTSANIAVAMAWLTDITPAEKRAGRFGLFNATFGAGFIIGPVLGGLLGDYDLRLPFIVAAVLNGGNMLLAFCILKESRLPAKRKMTLAGLNPLRPMRWLFSAKNLLTIALVFFFLSATGEVYGTCWALWGQDMFQWNGAWIGLSLAAFGVCQTLAQAFLPGPATRRLGERGAILCGIACSCTALIVLSMTQQSWMVFAVMPLIALGGIGTPALQTLATRQVHADQQGQLQGVLASTVSLASIVAPLVFSSLYFGVRTAWPGAIWLSVVVLYVFALPLIFRCTRTQS
ncbi:TCR/Tet family MFS transporter [Klebsiella sp. I138]|uniref:TCR/Tet family MFS transporter n=1 Tax=Klebsiella sp. I138 TaxID=2755385 RepID=UPI003DA8F4D2